MTGTKMTIGQIRDAIRAASWTRNDYSGHTREEFKRANVGPVLHKKVAELRALNIPARFAKDIARRDEEIEYCNAMIGRWETARNTPAPSASYNFGA